MLLYEILLFIVGLVFGSFISAISYRYPRRISWIWGRSFCPNCKQKISWYDNIPLVSFIFLGGKCRNCKNPISWRYPMVELATGIGFLFIGLNIFYLVLFCILELIFITDLEHQIIPDLFIFVGLLAGILFGFSFGNIFAGFFASLLLMLIHLFTRGRGMGLGDVKFAVLGGILTGPNLMPVWLFLAFLTGGMVGIILIIGKVAGLKDKIAFGPFLVVTIPITILWGGKIIEFLLLR